MDDAPTFAIAVPVGHYTPLLADTLRSLAVQDRKLRVGLMDASGDPRVRGLAEAFAPLLSYRRHGPDGGQAAAIAEGWRALDGDYLGWLNCDDVLAPDALATVAALAAGDRPDLVFGQSVFFRHRGGFTGYFPAFSPDTATLRQGCTISQPSCFIARTALERVGGIDESRHYVMDWDLWLRAADAGCRVAATESVLSAVYIGDDTKTGRLDWRRYAEIDSVLRRHNGPGARLRQLYAFLRYHAETYGPTAAILRAILHKRLLAGGKRPPGEFRGLSSWRNLVSGACSCELFDYEDTPRSVVAVMHRGSSAPNVAVRGEGGLTEAETVLSFDVGSLRTTIAKAEFGRSRRWAVEVDFPPGPVILEEVLIA